jgi:hypothetical protein
MVLYLVKCRDKFTFTFTFSFTPNVAGELIPSRSTIQLKTDHCLTHTLRMSIVHWNLQLQFFLSR